jgi:hypothetical protein
MTDFTILQIWTLLCNSRGWISAFLRNGFPFEYTRHRNINPFQQTEHILPRQRILFCFLSKEFVATEYTTMREGILYVVRIYLL